MSKAYRCPKCREKLVYQSDAYMCMACKSRWPIRDGISWFSKSEFDWGYTERETKLTINQIARKEGWQTAIRLYASLRGETYDYFHEFVNCEASADFRFFFSLGPTSTVLEMDSGWGNVAVSIAPHVGEMYTLDSSFENACFLHTRAKQEGLSNLHVSGGDVSSLPFNAETFDLVIMIGALERVSQHMGSSNPLAAQKQALHNLRTVLKPNGGLCLITDNRFSFRSLLGQRDAHTGLRFISVMPRWAGNLYSRLVRQRPYVEWTPSRVGLKKLLLEAGFLEIRNYFPVPDRHKARFWLDYQDKAASQFLLNSLRAFPTFNLLYYSAGKLGLALGIESLISPSLCSVGIVR